MNSGNRKKTKNKKKGCPTLMDDKTTKYAFLKELGEARYCLLFI